MRPETSLFKAFEIFDHARSQGDPYGEHNRIHPRSEAVLAHWTSGRTNWDRKKTRTRREISITRVPMLTGPAKTVGLGLIRHMTDSMTSRGRNFKQAIDLRQGKFSFRHSCAPSLCPWLRVNICAAMPISLHDRPASRRYIP